MFGRKINSQDLAVQLSRALLPSGADYIGSYIQAVRPDESERVRLMFSLLLFPVTASYGAILTTTNQELKDSLIEAHEIYLSSIRDQDQLVRLGDYIIWRVEREAIARVLRERYFQLLVSSDFDEYQIRYGLLIRLITDMRQQTYLNDIDLGMSQGNETKEGISEVFTTLGTSFTRYILNIDPMNYSLNQSDKDRLMTSIAHGSSIQGHGFFGMSDVLKKFRL